jgi:hypothetical protein
MTLPRCPHCRKLFHSEPHNAWHQRCCTGKACQHAPSLVPDPTVRHHFELPEDH